MFHCDVAADASWDEKLGKFFVFSSTARRKFSFCFLILKKTPLGGFVKFLRHDSN